MSSVSLAVTDYPLMGVVGSCDHFLKFCYNHIFGIGEAKDFKWCVLFDIRKY